MPAIQRTRLGFNVFLAAAAVACVCGAAANFAPAQTVKMPGGDSTGPGKIKVVIQQPEARIGQIFIVGNDVTTDAVILRVMGLKSGQVLNGDDLRAAEQKLKRLGFFDTNPDTAPSISILPPFGPNGLESFDLLVRVTETKNTGSLSFKPCITSNGLSICLVAEERNFDPSRFPYSLADIWDGRAFRGAAQKLQLNLIEIPIVRFPFSLPMITANQQRDSLTIAVGMLMLVATELWLFSQDLWEFAIGLSQESWEDARRDLRELWQGDNQ